VLAHSGAMRRRRTTVPYAPRLPSTDRGRRFDGIDVSVDPRGALTLLNAPAWMTVRVHDELPAGDHDSVLLRVEEIDSLPGAEAIVFHHSRFKELAPADVTV